MLTVTKDTLQPVRTNGIMKRDNEMILWYMWEMVSFYKIKIRVPRQLIQVLLQFYIQCFMYLFSISFFFLFFSFLFICHFLIFISSFMISCYTCLLRYYYTDSLTFQLIITGWSFWSIYIYIFKQFESLFSYPWNRLKYFRLSKAIPERQDEIKKWSINIEWQITRL